jgi:hypothetical protein
MSDMTVRNEGNLVHVQLSMDVAAAVNVALFAGHVDGVVTDTPLSPEHC